MYQSKNPYLYGTGRRKSSVARVHLFPNGTGSITINAAEMLGVSDRIGSVETGKDADFTLYADDPIDMMTTPVMTVIRGSIAHRR